MRYGPHMLPIFERPALVSTLVHAHSRGLQVPVFWQVSEGAYSLVRSWSAFDFSSEFLLLTTTGRRMLYLEADDYIEVVNNECGTEGDRTSVSTECTVKGPS